jgi:subtilisin family serine protease
MPADVNPPVVDPDLGKTYGMSKIGATDAWKTFNGSKDFVVADIDTGIDYNHEDLAFNLWRQKDDKGQEFVGYDFVHNDNLPFDDNEHGTHTAGTIGAVGGNGKGVSGVTQRVSLMALKFLSGEGSGTTADAIRAIDYAVEHGAKVLSNSWGGKGDDNNAALKEAIERARAKDVLFVAAAGNDGTDNDGSDPSYPAGFDNDNLISVAATDSSDELAFFSNYGKKSVHLAAPGVNVYSTVPGNKYKQESGTSMACPHVAGAAALLWSRHPDWNYKKVKEVLLSSVDQVSSLQGKTVTGGRLNILKALRSTE